MTKHHPDFHATTLRPMFDRVLIRPIEEKKASDGGIIIPDTVKSDTKFRKGKVLAVGNGDRLKNGERAPMYCRPGDTVLYTSNPNQDCELDIDDEKVLCSVINEEQFLYAILD